MEPSFANHRTNPYVLLLTPSPIGIVLYTFLAALIIALNQFSSVEKYLQVPSNFQIGHIVFTDLDHLLTRLIGEGRTAALVVGAFWALVGLGVYIFLRGISRLLNDLGEGYESRGFMWPRGANRNEELREAIRREIFRILAFIGLLIVVFGPLAAVINGPHLIGAFSSHLLLRLGLWFAAGWLTMHLAVVLLRLVAMRPRLFD